jgi:hypothetical protein
MVKDYLDFIKESQRPIEGKESTVLVDPWTWVPVAIY